MREYFYCSLIFAARKPPEEDPAVTAQDIPQPINEGEEVLARWSDDGWYYRGEMFLKFFCLSGHDGFVLS